MILGTSFFLESVTTSGINHSAQWLSEDITRVFEAHPGVHFAGAVSDNAPANQAAWKMLQEKYPNKFFYGKHTVPDSPISFVLIRLCISRAQPVGEGHHQNSRRQREQSIF